MPRAQILSFKIFSEALKQSNAMIFIFKQLSTQESAKVMSKVNGTICSRGIYSGGKIPSPQASF